MFKKSNGTSEVTQLQKVAKRENERTKVRITKDDIENNNIKEIK